MSTPLPISVLATWHDPTGPTGKLSFGVETLDEIAPWMTNRPLGTVRITLDITLPDTIAPCQWLFPDGGQCGVPSVVTREMAWVIDTLDIGLPSERPACAAWRSIDLCFTHLSEMQTKADQGLVLHRQPKP